jgi:hypothetical protein
MERTGGAGRLGACLLLVAVFQVKLIGEGEAKISFTSIHVVDAHHQRVQCELRSVGLELPAQVQPRTLLELSHEPAVRTLQAVSTCCRGSQLFRVQTLEINQCSTGHMCMQRRCMCRCRACRFPLCFCVLGVT